MWYEILDYLITGPCHYLLGPFTWTYLLAPYLLGLAPFVSFKWVFPSLFTGVCGFRHIKFSIVYMRHQLFTFTWAPKELWGGKLFQLPLISGKSITSNHIVSIAQKSILLDFFIHSHVLFLCGGICHNLFQFKGRNLRICMFASYVYLFLKKEIFLCVQIYYFFWFGRRNICVCIFAPI